MGARDNWRCGLIEVTGRARELATALRGGPTWPGHGWKEWALDVKWGRLALEPLPIFSFLQLTVPREAGPVPISDANSVSWCLGSQPLTIQGPP